MNLEYYRCIENKRCMQGCIDHVERVRQSSHPMTHKETTPAVAVARATVATGSAPALIAQRLTHIFVSLQQYCKLCGEGKRSYLCPLRPFFPRENQKLENNKITKPDNNAYPPKRIFLNPLPRRISIETKRRLNRLHTFS